MSTVKPDFERIQSALASSLRVHWKLFLIEGIVLVILGLAAVMLPLIATLTIALVVGWVFLLRSILAHLGPNNISGIGRGDIDHVCTGS
jgi:uncharacterized membrane protein HdeD (DUF308 family)